MDRKIRSTDFAGRDPFWDLDSPANAAYATKVWNISTQKYVTSIIPRSLYYPTVKLGSEMVQSEGHPFPYREGGDFTLQRVRRLAPMTPVIGPSGAFEGAPGERCSGYLRINIENIPYSSFPAIHRFPGYSNLGSGQNVILPTVNDTSSTYGATGYARFKPGAPVMNLGQSLIELRELPMMFRHTYKVLEQIRGMSVGELLNPKNLAADYLGYQFGWIPFLSDIKGLLGLRHSLQTRIAQLRRDNGRSVRRRGSVYEVSNPITTVTGGPFFSSTMCKGTYPLYQNSYGSIVEQFTSGQKHWFAGRFRYWIPDLGPDRCPPRLYLKLLGLNPTPKLLYDVLPWSWLLDWVTNLGDNIDNVSANAAENLVAEYAYIMSHTYSRYHVTVSAVNQNYISGSIEVETKLRRGASPFGFGTTPNAFTNRQWAVLGALGLTRLSYPRMS